MFTKIKQSVPNWNCHNVETKIPISMRLQSRLICFSTLAQPADKHGKNCPMRLRDEFWDHVGLRDRLLVTRRDHQLFASARPRSQELIEHRCPCTWLDIRRAASLISVHWRPQSLPHWRRCRCNVKHLLLIRARHESKVIPTPSASPSRGIASQSLKRWWQRCSTLPSDTPLIVSRVLCDQSSRSWSWESHCRYTQTE